MSRPDPGLQPFLLFTLVATMMGSTLQLFVVAVGASEIIDDLGISRGVLGLVTALNTLVGALVAPRIGKLTDRIGSRLSVVCVLGVAAVGLWVTSLASSIWLLALGSIISGVPDGWGNPATNKLIADRVPEGRRGTTTGIKQSGVQVAVFVTGLLFPTLTGWTSWRTATAMFAVMIAVFGLAVAVGLPKASAAERRDIADGIRPLAAAEHAMVRRLALYALLMGIGGGAFGRWLPLFAEESLGMSTRTAGFVVAVMGVTGIAARVIWGRLAETRIAPIPALRILGVASVATFLLAAASPSISPATLWIAAILAAFSVNAWNAVAMLAVITHVPRSLAGRASGPVLLGFLGGLTIGSPLAGWSIDLLDDYRPAWIAAAVLAVLAVQSLGARRPVAAGTVAGLPSGSPPGNEKWDSSTEETQPGL